MGLRPIRFRWSQRTGALSTVDGCRKVTVSEHGVIHLVTCCQPTTRQVMYVGWCIPLARNREIPRYMYIYVIRQKPSSCLIRSLLETHCSCSRGLLSHCHLPSSFVLASKVKPKCPCGNPYGISCVRHIHVSLQRT